MKRRTVLAAAATTATASVAGCLTGSDEPGGSGSGDDSNGNGSPGGGGTNGDDEPSGGGDGSSDDDEGSGDDGDDSDRSGVDGSEITGRSIETTEQTCGSQDVSEASMTVEDGAIVVEGTVSASTPCHDAVLSTAAVGDRTLRMDVELSQQDGFCQQCLGEISYEATIELANPTGLESVQVSHAGGSLHQFDVE